MNKKKILFSQGGILIQKEIDDKKHYEIEVVSRQVFVPSNTEDNIVRDTRVIGKVKRGAHKGKYKCVSPLGFYYYKSIGSYHEIKREEESRRQCYIIFNKQWRYEISYLVSNNGTSIGHETRPWDLVGNGMSDHFIADLEKVINQIIDELIDNKYEKVSSFKEKIFTELFGSVDGIKTQTNDLKILSHGFDLKTSFRKEKEK